jgi:hypothetical protein
MTCLDRDTIALLTKRVYDIAGCDPPVHVTLNHPESPLDQTRWFPSLRKASPELWPEEVDPVVCWTRCREATKRLCTSVTTLRPCAFSMKINPSFTHWNFAP